MHSGLSLPTLVRYMAWANSVLYQSLRTEPHDTIYAPRPMRPAGLIGVLGHIYVVSLIWKANLTGQDHGFTTRALDGAPTLAELQSSQETVDRWYIEFVDSQPIETLSSEIRFTFVDGGAGAMRGTEMLLHVVNHSTYHRGYVADMLYETGSRPPTMDLPVFIRDVSSNTAART